MKQSRASAQGDRIDLGGKLPQFDAFAFFAYRELARNNLLWIRIADPKALKLDDILYATTTQIHAYQVKWSNLEKPEPFSFKDFQNLIRGFADGWNSLKVVLSSENKPVIIHLLTNRPISRHDSILTSHTKVGSFDNFFRNVWLKLKTHDVIEQAWQPVVDQLQKTSGLDDAVFDEFVKNLELDFSFQPHAFGINQLNTSQQNDDLLLFSRFLFEEVAGRNRQVQYAAHLVIQQLGWLQRLRTTFNHEFILDPDKYQPIHESIISLDQKIKQYKSGYIFLIGGPGSGKSTLLTQWSRNRIDRIIRYYAFDFANPSSTLNYSERGEAVNLYFDLVLQLRQSGVHIGDFILHKDIVVLREIFTQQLNRLSEDYAQIGKSTIIIIDGLDHVPREYKNVNKTFLAELLPPASIPQGVYIILGSQTYEMESLQLDVRLEWERQTRNITIAPLAKKEVFIYIDSSEIGFTPHHDQKERIFQASQGHPLYLSYLVSKLKQSAGIAEFLNLEKVEGDINVYYRKLWQPISTDSALINFFGLICRIKGLINPRFISEWLVDDHILLEFRMRAMHLFDEGDEGWVFFHNSFRQFLVYETAQNILLRQFDRLKDIHYHKLLAELYVRSEQEKNWQCLFHFFHAEAYDEFTELASPEAFVEQLISFRPPGEIDFDIRLGMQIGKAKKDIYVLVRYLFAATELQRRLSNFDPASFSKDFIELGKSGIAKSYLRTQNHLLCSKEFAYRAARWFYEFNDMVEAKILFSLAEPEEILDDRIVLNDSHRYEEIQTILFEWASTAVLFEPLKLVLQRITNLQLDLGDSRLTAMHPVEKLKGELLERSAASLNALSRFHQVEEVFNEFDLKNEYQRISCFNSITTAIEHCIENHDFVQGKAWLNLLISRFKKENLGTRGKIYTADLIYEVLGDVKQVMDYLKGVTQPDKPDPIRLDYDGRLDEFALRIKFNKLLNVCGNGEAITIAVPSTLALVDETIVEFERMLCLITQVWSDGLLKRNLGNIAQRLLPAIRFYYRTVSHRDSYWYKLTLSRAEYFKFLISAVAVSGFQPVGNLIDKILEEWVASPKYWPAQVKRAILLIGFEVGFNPQRIKEELQLMESDMLKGLEVSERIAECQKHVDAWIRLEDDQKADLWMRNTILHSTGVGYSKDYQFSAWIKWLEKVNTNKPERSKERIEWFLSILGEIKETTDGRAYHRAAYALLELTFKSNSGWGFQQMTWQLKSGLLSFIDAMEAATEKLIHDSDNQLDFFQARDLFLHLILYVAETPLITLFEQLLDKGYSLCREKFLDVQIPLFINQIKIVAVEENRNAYYLAIYRFLGRGKLNPAAKNYDIPAPSTLEKDENRPSNELVLMPGRQRISETEVLLMLKSFDAFMELVGKEDLANSRFVWSKVINKIEPFVTCEKLRKVITVLEPRPRSTDLYSVLSTYATKLGDIPLARNFADLALKNSSSSGWMKYYDGGTRIIAMGAYRAFSIDEATEKAFSVFCDDILQSDYPGSYVENLEDVLPLLTKDLNLERAWNEIEGYLKRLMRSDGGLTSQQILYEEDTPDDLNCQLLLYLCRFSVRFVNTIAKKIIVNHISASEKLRKEVALLINGGHEKIELFISLMVGLEVVDKSAVSRFMPEIDMLLESDNFFIRQTASKLKSNLISDFVPPYRAERPLGIIYSLEIQNPVSLTDEIPIESQGFVRNTHSPFELIRPFMNWLEILSKKTNIPKANLAYRWKAIMEKIDDPAKLTAEYEQELRYNLTRIDFDYAYPRPRTLIAERALYFLVSELCDAKVLSEVEMKNYLIFFDHSIDFVVSILPRPKFIYSITDGKGNSLSKDWISTPEQNLRLSEGLIEYKPGWYVIGEYTKQRSLAWGLATQKFMMNLSFDGENNETRDYEIFGTVFNRTNETYHDIEFCPREPHILVINDNRFINFDAKTRWLAFNPNLAFYLDWLPEKKSLFGWKDLNGELVAESLFWSDSNMHMPPPKLHSEAGEGWFVIISKKGLSALQQVDGNFRIRKRIIRIINEEGDRTEKKYDIEKTFQFE